MSALVTIIGPLIPVLVKIVFAYMNQKKVDRENAVKFIEAIQSIDALKSVDLKNEIDAINDEFDRRDMEDK